MIMREKIMRALIFFTLAIPAFPPSLLPVFQPYTFGKTVLFEIAVELMLCILLSAHLRKSDFLRWQIGIARAIFFMLCAFLISTALSINFLESFWGSSARMDGLFTLAHFAIFFFILTAEIKKDMWEKYMRWSVCASIFVTLYGFTQWFGAPFVALSEGEILSTLGNPAYFATYLLFHFFLSLYCAHRAQSKEFKTVFFLIAALEIFALVLAQVTAVFLALAVVFCILLIKDRPWKSFAMIALVLAITASPVIRKLSPSNDGNALAMQSRLRVWRIAASASFEKPFFGHGANQFERVFLDYKSQGYPMPRTGETFDKPHNAFLEIAFSYGLLGLCAYLYLLWIAFSRIGEITDTYERQIFRGMLSAYLISLFFLFDTFSSLLIFFFLLAFFASSYEAAPRSNPPKSDFGGLHMGKIALFILCFFPLFFAFHFKPLYSAYFARQFLFHADSARTANETLKKKALAYDSFNSPFIARAILITEKNLKK